MLSDPVRVIVVTDGDCNACQVIESLAEELGLRCISASAGNPTPLSGKEIVSLLKQTPYDPVLVMFDDRGNSGKGRGESALEYVVTHPDITVLGALAVASGAKGISGAVVDFCIKRDGQLALLPVDKNGRVCGGGDQLPVVYGDTLGVLDSLEVPLVIGVGDIGKMSRADDLTVGAPVTRKAILEILKRSDVRNDARAENRQRH